VGLSMQYLVTEYPDSIFCWS